MNYDELQQDLERMKAAGLNPLLCDTRVPLVDVPVLAGVPAEAGDATNGAYVLLPRELFGQHPTFLIDVDGLSMRDAGIMPGDRLEVQMDATANDGDIVVAEVDGNYTVKTLFTDGDGIKWLVPRNPEYEPIRLTGRNWRIIGKVIGLYKGVPHTSYADCAKAVMKVRQQAAAQKLMDTSTPLPDMPQNLVFRQFYRRRPINLNEIRRQVERIIVKQMRHAYEWYAAYRVLFDLGVLDDLKLTRFAAQMNAWFPEAPIKCNADRMGDYAVGHTGKAYTLWSSEQFRRDCQRGQSAVAFNALFHRCEELHAALFPLPVYEEALPF